jgi:hypothetical protein
MASYGDSFTCLYVDDVRTSQETRVWASAACYEDGFTFLYVDDVRTSQETAYGPPRPVTEIGLLWYALQLYLLCDNGRFVRYQLCIVRHSHSSSQPRLHRGARDCLSHRKVQQPYHTAIKTGPSN